MKSAPELNFRGAAMRFPEEFKRTLRRYIGAAFGFTVVINLIHLVGPLFMLQIYDRVLTSGSLDTLIFLTTIALFLLAMFAVADGGRRRVFALAGYYFGRVFDRPTAMAALRNPNCTAQQSLGVIADMGKVQGALTNGSIAPLFDAPFAPFFLALLFFVHPVLGSIGLIGTIILLGLAVFSDRATRSPVEAAQIKEQHAQTLLAHTLRQRSALVSMGMTETHTHRWNRLRNLALKDHLANVSIGGFLVGVARSSRMILQSLILAVGGFLVFQQEMSPGAIIAASIILGRALAPVDQIIGLLRQLIGVRQSWIAVQPHLTMETEKVRPATPMPRPAPQVELEGFELAAPNCEQLLLPEITHEFKSGAIVALLGPSGVGKSTFLQALAGAVSPASGIVRLGDRDIHRWDEQDRGRYVGFLPQDVELLTGTVFENIARFNDADVEDVYGAARAVGCHELILSLPEGYDTVIGVDGLTLSAGQRQSIGLARAVFGDPALLLFDEPSSHLDRAMKTRFKTLLSKLKGADSKARPSTVFIATHDHELLHQVDQIALLQMRRIVLMTREEYVRKVSDFQVKEKSNTASPRGGKR